MCEDVAEELMWGWMLNRAGFGCFLPDIEPCLDNELGEFPLRMRDWLKNVLVTLYERDEDNNLLTEKQKLRVSSDIKVQLKCSRTRLIEV